MKAEEFINEIIAEKGIHDTGICTKIFCIELMEAYAKQEREKIIERISNLPQSVPRDRLMDYLTKPHKDEV